jgi:LacI family transcriptional regulator
MAGHKLLNSYAHITAAFIVADIMALGIIKLMNQIGKSIPKDLSIIGFDDLSVCEYSFPGLTTIRQDIYRKGIEVAKLLINKINGKDGNTGIILPVELILRETTIPLTD